MGFRFGPGTRRLGLSANREGGSSSHGLLTAARDDVLPERRPSPVLKMIWHHVPSPSRAVSNLLTFRPEMGFGRHPTGKGPAHLGHHPTLTHQIMVVPPGVPIHMMSKRGEAGRRADGGGARHGSVVRRRRASGRTVRNPCRGVDAGRRGGSVCGRNLSRAGET